MSSLPKTDKSSTTHRPTGGGGGIKVSAPSAEEDAEYEIQVNEDKKQENSVSVGQIIWTVLVELLPIVLLSLVN